MGFRALSLALALLLTVSPALADNPSAKTEATRLSAQGTAAYDRGDYAVALAYFERAHRVYPSAKLEYNLGLALGGMGRYAEAIDAFSAFLAQAKDAPADARAYAQQRLAELRMRIGTIDLTLAPEGAELRVDDALVHWAAGGLRVLPGAHTLTASKPGYRTGTVEITAVAGERVPARIELERLPPPIAAKPTTIVMMMAPAPAPKPKRSRAWIWITTGTVGAVALGLGLGLGLGLKSDGPSSTLGTYSSGLP